MLVGTVMSCLFRGRKLLQKHLRDYAAGSGVLKAKDVATDASAPASLEDYRQRKQRAG